MHLDEWPSGLGAGLKKNAFAPQSSRHGWGRGGPSERGETGSHGFLNCTFTAWEPRPAPRKCPADKSQCELLKDYFPRPTRGRWKWVLSGAAVWQGHSHPAQGQPRPGGAPCLRSLWLDPALNNQLSCRIPGGFWVPSALETRSRWRSQTTPPLPLPLGLGGTFLKIPSRVKSKQGGPAWVLVPLLKKPTGWLGRKQTNKKSGVDPTLQGTRRGR